MYEDEIKASTAKRNLIALTILTGIIGVIILCTGIYFISTGWMAAGFVGCMAGAYLITMVPDNIKFMRDVEKGKRR